MPRIKKTTDRGSSDSKRNPRRPPSELLEELRATRASLAERLAKMDKRIADLEKKSAAQLVISELVKGKGPEEIAAEEAEIRARLEAVQQARKLTEGLQSRFALRERIADTMAGFPEAIAEVAKLPPMAQPAKGKGVSGEAPPPASIEDLRDRLGALANQTKDGLLNSALQRLQVILDKRHVPGDPAFLARISDADRFARAANLGKLPPDAARELRQVVAQIEQYKQLAETKRGT